MIKTDTFTSQQTKRTFNIFLNLKCKSEYLIYLVECMLCRIQYVGKAETKLNLRLNNHGKHTKKIYSSLETFSTARYVYIYIYIYIYINIFYLHVYFYPLLVDIVPTCPESSLQYYDYDPRAAYF